MADTGTGLPRSSWTAASSFHTVRGLSSLTPILDTLYTASRGTRARNKDNRCLLENGPYSGTIRLRLRVSISQSALIKVLLS